MTTARTQSRVGFKPIQVNGIKIYQHRSISEAIKFAYLLVSRQVNRKTVFVISRGEKLLDLYRLFAKFDRVEPGAILMGQEVLGDPFHYYSVEVEFQRHGLIEAFSKRGVPFHRILSRTPTLNSLLRLYSKHYENLTRSAEQVYAFVELDKQGTFGGITPQLHRQYCEAKNSTDNKQQTANDTPRHKQNYPYVCGYSEVDAESNSASDKVCLTHQAFEQVDVIWAFAFGKSVRPVIKKIVNSGPSKDCPASFFCRYQSEVRLFTDQNVV